MTPPSTIAHFKLTGKLGEGGMGAVYRATDTKLNREVAIKVLPDSFAADPDRLARFTREAQVLASLNHPNIAAIYGVEESALVMELVEGGEPRGPLAEADAMALIEQLIDALEYAHERGVVHRDLKPANIKITPEGRLKVLDFGLAKAMSGDTAAGNPMSSPTLTMRATIAGTIMGTAAYMAPEQARGHNVDQRADIWAFGVVFYELVTGKLLFDGATVSDTLASVLRQEIDLNATPPRFHALLRACLERDPKRRLRHIGDARLLLAQPPAQAAPAPPSSPKLAWLPWAAAVLALAAAGAALFRPSPPTPATVRFSIPLPDGTTESRISFGPQAVPSPDGRYLAFIASTSEKNAVWIRPLDSASAHRLDNTEGARYPFWSPDGKYIGYFADGRLKRILAAGGPAKTLCDIKLMSESIAGGYGATWNQTGAIVFGSGNGAPLLRVSAEGGVPSPATSLEPGASRHQWPQFLPDGRHLLYFSLSRDPGQTGIYVQELGSPQRTLLMKCALPGVWAPPGYLLFVRQGTLFAQRMDPRTFRLTGEPVSLAEDVTASEGLGNSTVAVSGNGMLVYHEGSNAELHQLAWYSRDGTRLGAARKTGAFKSMRLSPDGKSAALAVPGEGGDEVWVMDLLTGALSRASGAPNTTVLGPWSPDSGRAAISKPDGILAFTKASGKLSSLTAEPNLYAYDWSPDGRFLLCGDSLSGRKLVVVPLENGAKPQTILDGLIRNIGFRFAPDGKFVAYTSSDSGHPQIMVASFPSFTEKRQVSIDGGEQPTWRNDGKELFFQLADGTLMSVDVRTEPKIEAGVPKPLFKTDPLLVGRFSYWPAADGKRFLVVESDKRNQPAGKTTVVLNWASELKQP